MIAATSLAALAAFAYVQDRVTAAGARRYAALAAATPPGALVTPSVEQVMAPAIADSVRRGTAAALGVLVVGLGSAGVLARRLGASGPRSRRDVSDRR